MANKISYVPSGSGETYWILGDLFTFLVTGEESSGSYFTVQVIVGPGNGPPTHIHHSEDEQFYILEGELTFWVGDQTFQVSAGDFIHIPREIPHSFKNGQTPAKLLATFSPAGIEGFFREIGEPATDRLRVPPITPETIARFMAVEASGWKDHNHTLPLRG